MSHKYPVSRPAVTTGIETEGPSAGELVCPEIYLWAIDSRGVRKKRVTKVEHNKPVRVLELTHGPGGENLYFIVADENSRIKGWVTERFLNFQDG